MSIRGFLSMSNTVVAGYEVRQIRGEQSLALVLHVMNMENFTSWTTIRLVTEEPREIAAFLAARADKFGQPLRVNENARPLKLGIKGKDLVGKVAGHSVTYDAWFGFRAWVWIDMAGEGGQVNVPALVAEVAAGDVRKEAEASGLSIPEMVREYIAGTVPETQAQYKLRDVYPVILDGHGRYHLATYTATSKPAVDSAGSEELRA
jgi:hypothetical protein